jgi:RNA polymerase sigma-70 factor (ECF subfamily)
MEARHLIEGHLDGDRGALADWFERYRDRLRRMVELRMDPRLRARLDASDVLQEAYLELAGDLVGRELGNVRQYKFRRLRAVR